MIENGITTNGQALEMVLILTAFYVCFKVSGKRYIYIFIYTTLLNQNKNKLVIINHTLSIFFDN